MKIDLETIQQVLSEQKIDAAKAKTIIKELEALAEEEKTERAANKQPKQKNQFVLVCVTEEEEVKKIISSATVYVTQIKEGSDHNDVVEKIKRAGIEFNAETRSGQKNPLKSITSIINCCKRKFFKNAAIMVKTTEPAIIVVTPNKI